MNISLQATAMMGHWPVESRHVCEFQHGRIMIYVLYDDAHPMQERLAMAQRSIDTAFADVDAALAHAERVSAITQPQFWKQARRITLKVHPLAVFGIFYELGSQFPEYMISWNPDFRPEEGTDYSADWAGETVRVEAPDDDEFITVARTETGEFVEMKQPRSE